LEHDTPMLFVQYRDNPVEEIVSIYASFSSSWRVILLPVTHTLLDWACMELQLRMGVYPCGTRAAASSYRY
jgi:hypothetical protein